MLRLNHVHGTGEFQNQWIQIQPMLRLNRILRIMLSVILGIQIQPMLRLNHSKVLAELQWINIQIQPMLRLNGFKIEQRSGQNTFKYNQC